MQNAEELTVFPCGGSPVHLIPAVTEVVTADGQSALRVQPPQYGRGQWVMGVVIGSPLVGLALWVLAAPGANGYSTGLLVTASLMVAIGLGVIALFLTHESHWILDREGIHAVTGWGVRSTDWSEISRLRVVAFEGGGAASYWHKRRLFFLDSQGRALRYLPHVTGKAPIRMGAFVHVDIGALKGIADECHRRGWLTGVEAFRAAGNEDNITPLMGCERQRRGHGPTRTCAVHGTGPRRARRW